MKLPYSPRGNQPEIIDRINSAIRHQSHIVLESPTGSGKTFCSLAAVLPIAIENNLRIVYCVRTNSQQKQVVHELQQFRKVGYSISAVAFQGRESLCPEQKYDNELKRSNWVEKSKICKSLKTQSRMGESGCRFYRKLLRGGDSLVKKWSSDILTAEEFAEQAEEAGICPYELNKLILKEAKVVIVPYVYFFEEFIRKFMLGRMCVSLDKVIVVVDEAHNLPDWSRNAASESLTIETINRAVVESNKYGLQLADGRHTTSFLNIVEASIESLSDYHIPDNEEEGLLPSHLVAPDSEVPTFETEMMSLGKMTLYNLQRDSSEIAKMGQLIR